MSVHSFILGREQYRREMRAALHDLQQRLGQCLNGPAAWGLSAQPVLHCRQSIESEGTRYRSSKVFTPFLLSERYLECGQVDKDM
jgi:hypothetical protein